jgi:hypothetical protein
MFSEIKYLYPNAIPQVDFELRDDSQGEGVYIHQWNTPKLGVQPTSAQLQVVSSVAVSAQVITSLVATTQTYIDSKAKEKGYDNANSCISYLNSINPTWKSEATKMNIWRDAVWEFCYGNAANVTPTTTWETLLVALPIAPW